MKVLLLAVGFRPELQAAAERHSLCLLPLLDRPFLQHVVEHLAACGEREIHMLLSHRPEQVEALFGKGTRWGTTIHYHLAGESATPLTALRALGIDDEEEVLLVDTSRLCLDRNAWNDLLAPGAAPRVLWNDSKWHRGDDSRRPWGGAAVCTGAFVNASLMEQNLDGIECALAGASTGEGQRIACRPPLSLLSYEDYLNAQRRALTGVEGGLLLTGVEPDPGVRLSRNVVLHPTASIDPPVFIGQNCRIGRGATIGPVAAIGANCVIDSRSSIRNSVVLPGSYVGEFLAVEDSIVDHNRLIHARLGGVTDVTDNFILGSLHEGGLRRAAEGISLWLATVCLAVLTLPVLALTALVRIVRVKSPGLVKRPFVRLPATSQVAQWQTAHLAVFDGACESVRAEFLNVVVPGLWSALRGKLRLVGLPPRSERELLALPSDWRELCLPSHVGLITEARTMCPTCPNKDEAYTADAFYSVSRSLGHDLRLVGRYLLRVIRP